MHPEREGGDNIEVRNRKGNRTGKGNQEEEGRVVHLNLFG
jgi:hypothetical protein